MQVSSQKIILSFILISGLFFSSCYKTEVLDVPATEKLLFLMEPEQIQTINEARDIKFAIEDPKPDLRYNGEVANLKSMSLRGNTALRFHRKSFNVDLSDPLYFPVSDRKDYYPLTEFRLVAMVTDYTYIENRISYGILNKLNVQPLFYRYIETIFNDQTQGLYLLIENPEFYAVNIHGSEMIIRRGYNASVDDYRYISYGRYSPGQYTDTFKSLYATILQYQGEELYNKLNVNLNLTSYFRKMITDYLLKNGDYTDEIYFYAMPEEQNIRFDILPWDYDDIFADKPHEVGADWGMGRAYGNRSYATMDDIKAEIGDKLIFSIEDDLDYTIAKDSFLYARYLDEIKTFLEKITPGFIESEFQEILSELDLYLVQDEIIGQSRYDRDPFNYSEWKQNLINRKGFLLERLYKIQEAWEKAQSL